MRASLPLLLCAAATLAWAAPEDYNLPEARSVGAADADLAPTLMERAAEPEEWAAFAKAHPAGFWLFGERRDRAVRPNLLPAVWLTEAGREALGGFRGEARPGEFYVFQVVIVGGAHAPQPTIAYAARPEGNALTRLFREAPPVTCLSLEGTDRLGRPLLKRLPWPGEGEVKPLWFGVQVPEDAAGALGFVIEIGGRDFPVRLEVSGEPIEEGGVHEGWRLARLRWLNSAIGQEETVTAPFTPVEADLATRTLRILGREVVLGADGLPAAYRSFFNGSNTRADAPAQEGFAEAPAFTVGGRPFVARRFAFTERGPVGVSWVAESVSADGAWVLTVRGRLEYDGFLSTRLSLRAADGASARHEGVALALALTPAASRYAMGLGLEGGAAPRDFAWRWDTKKHQDALWVGGVNQGLMLRLKGENYVRPLINAYYAFRPLNLPEGWGDGGVTLRRAADGSAHLTLTGGPRDLAPDGASVYLLDWYLTPFKPIDPHFQLAENRIFHAHAGFRGEDWPALRAQGHTVANIHQGRAINPFINYPYNDAFLPRLAAEAQAAHRAGMKLKVYYTTRELTQNLPEFLALNALDGEIVLPRKPGVPWPVTNRNGPHPWLSAHLGDDFVPAWRETLRHPGLEGKLDLAVLTTPSTRWDNFYLEGLAYLLREAHIDGLYIDDTALDRHAMRRARRILDRDAPTRRLIDMHSWNHHNALAAWANSAICFMELYPYIDSLWHGEGAFTMGRKPDFILTEMSGIPFGLMSEQLTGPQNPWRGLAFGMLPRRPWAGDPRPAWRILDAFGLVPGTDLIGWWDPANPVKPSTDQALATLYRRPDGKTLLALANLTDKPLPLTLTVDWAALGLGPDQAQWRASASPGFQEAAAFPGGGPITLPAGRGLLLVAERR